ncbi:putative secreted protein [Wickerhamomyces ciferrii]|uniref:Secreted protein n=1 Tax=Wickerhamomyces ciferrii (strain ATCC 14091 / BCRC 22168 / CBS 111 / JCM 3599 / NBRC 0793 / NRRL Y-1031 F-60-10) TaxID=1206466 RepID=K0KY94_WICCF|nr:uncharacterized protein BN7_5656 [Wickerhamomyces ciferrii]CCH46068.1 putative secreted protein [Wickerhamomyces ciferrii]
MVKFTALLTSLVLSSVVSAATHTYNWTTGYDDRDLDGSGEKTRIITCNGEFPWPNIEINKGDTVNIYLTNGFDDNKNTSMHFHGLFQHGSSQMDGPEMVTQCPIGPGQTFLYNFTVPDQVGSYWYHSHTGGQYMDGMRGLFIIHDEDYPYKQGEDYDEELSLSFTEYYHSTTYELMPKFLSLYNPTGAEPIPQNFLMNNTRNLTWEVQPDTTYLLRLINIGGFTSYWFFIEDHEFDVIEVDGIPVERNTTDMLYITVAQRYTVLLKTKKDTSKNFAIMQLVDTGMLDIQPDDLIVNATHTLSYNKDNEEVDEAFVDSLEDDAFLDDFYLTPINKTELYGEPDIEISVDVVMDNLKNGINYAFFNNLTYTAPKVPILVSVLGAGDDATNAAIYGSNTHSFVLDKDDIVQIVVNNQDTGKHPFHLHGHAFQVVDRDHYSGPEDSDEPKAYDEDDHAEFPQYPMMRDTVYVRENSNMVLRFKADNPGVWFFHCHIEWHLEQGLALVLIEDPKGIQEDPNQQLTESHKAVCADLNIATNANVANNTVFTDLSGENVQQPPVPSGFTAKGYVAFVFSCVAGVLGLITISIYGLIDISNVEEKVARDLDIDVHKLAEDESLSNEKRPSSEVGVVDDNSSSSRK